LIVKDISIINIYLINNNYTKLKYEMNFIF